MSEIKLPIFEPKFWRERLKHVIHSPNLYISVYDMPRAVWDEIVEYNARKFKEYVKTGERVLDAGCGYGRFSEAVPPEMGYVGVDLSPDFIVLARRLYPTRTFYVSDLRKLLFENDYFDWAICISIRGMVIQNMGIEAWDDMQTELLRVAKRILIMEYTVDEDETKRCFVIERK